MGGRLNLDGGTLSLDGGMLTLDGGTRFPYNLSNAVRQIMGKSTMAIEKRSRKDCLLILLANTCYWLNQIKFILPFGKKYAGKKQRKTMPSSASTALNSNT